MAESQDMNCAHPGRAPIEEVGLSGGAAPRCGQGEDLPSGSAAPPETAVCGHTPVYGGQDAQRLLDRIPCGLCRARLDDDLTIELANAFFYRLFGYTAQEGRAAGLLSGRAGAYPPDWEDLRQRLDQALEQGDTLFELEHRFLYRGGEVRWLLTRVSRDGVDRGVLNCAMLDITDRKEMEERLRISEEEYRIAEQHSGSVLDIYDVAARTLTQPQAAADWFGLPAVVPDMPATILKRGLVVSGSRGEYARLFHEMNAGVHEGSAVVQMKNAAGGNGWFSARYTMIFGESGAPLRAVLSFENITERREKELAYQKWSQYFESMQEGSLGYYEFDLTEDTYARSENTLLSALPPDIRTFTGAVSHIAQHFLCPEDVAAYLGVFDRKNLLVQYFEGRREVGLEHRRKNLDGTPFWARGTIQLIQDPYNGDIKAFILIQNIDEEKQQALHVQRLCERDSLTALYNRRVATELIVAALEASRPETCHGLIILDVDCFKQLNDTYGHRFGDQVLRDLAETLQKELRAGDCCGRLGGDEFLIFWDDMQAPDDPTSRLEAISTALSRSYETGGSVSVTMGLASFPQDGGDFDALYQAADAALYAAKRSGQRYALCHEET